MTWIPDRWFLLSLLALLLLLSDAKAHDVPSPPGYLVFSLGPALEAYPVGLFLDYASDDKSAEIDNEADWMSLSLAPNDYDLKNGDRGVVYVTALPPGQYHFFRVSENDGNFIYGWHFWLPFTIRPRRVTYAGNFKFVAQSSKGIFGLPKPDGGYLAVSNEEGRDIAIAARKANNTDLQSLPLDVLKIDGNVMNMPPFCMPKVPDALTPGTNPPICLAGVAALIKGDYKRSIDLFEEALTKKDLPNDYRVTVLMDEGHAYHLIGNYEDAIREFTAVIAIAPDHAQAYIGRAGAFFLAGETGNSIADYSKALELASDDKSIKITALVGRAGGYFRENKIELSLTDYASAIELDPKLEFPRFLRGTVYWRLGRFVDAAQDFSELVRADPASARDTLWWMISANRSNQELAALSALARSKIDASAWPGKLVQFYLDGKAEDQVLRQARELDAHGRNWTERGHECDADFFIGEWRLLAGDQATAVSEFRKAITQCSPAFVVYGAAKAELDRLTSQGAARQDP